MTEIIWQLPINQSNKTNHDWIHTKAKFHGFVNNISLCQRHKQKTRSFETRNVSEVMQEKELVCKRCLELYDKHKLVDKITALNSFEITEWSWGLGELEYVLAALTEENLKILRDAGFSEDEISHSTDGFETDIDLVTLAFNYTNANCWSKTQGFFVEEVSYG